MKALIDWFSIPAHYTPILIVIYSLIEYVIGRTALIKPNSLIDLVLHLVSGRIAQVLHKSDAPPVDRENVN